MSAMPLIQPKQSTTAGDDLDHLYCCDPNLALCGTDITDHHEDDSLPGTCVVCLDLEDAPCDCRPAA